jgi:hypothetical protein
VTDPGPVRAWNPFRPLSLIADTGVGAAYKTMFATLRPLVTGRRVSVRIDDGTLVCTVTHLGSRLRLGRRTHPDVRLTVRDVSWRDHAFDEATVVLHDLHLRGHPLPTELVAAPVELTVELPAPALDELFRWAAPRFAGDIGPDGVARLHFAKRRGSGHVEVDARFDGATLTVTPRAVVRRKRWPLPARTPSYRVRVPELPHGLRLTSVDFAPGVVRLTGTLPQWRVDVPHTRLESIVGQLGAIGGPLSVIWSGTADTRR